MRPEFAAAPTGRPAVDLSVYLVTDTDQCGGPEEVVRTVQEAVAAGATLVQLRDPHMPDPEFVALGRQLVSVLHGTGVPLLINDRVHLVKAIGADGAHVGQDDMPVTKARELLGPDAILGLTADTPTELATVLDLPVDVIDYVGGGSLHITGTKPEAEPVGLDGIAEVARLSPWPMVAIGGVTASDAEDLARVGVAGLGVVSAICGHPDVSAATKALVDAWANAVAKKTQQ